MRIDSFVRLAVLFFGLALVAGCSSCGETGKDNEDSANSNGVNVITPKESAGVRPGPDNSNSKLVPYPGLENGNNVTLDESKVEVIDTSKAKPQPLQPKKMPDNSEIMTVQSPDGMSVIETRKFVGDKQLAKLERITKSANDRVVKVHLKNGKVVTKPNNKIKEFSTDPASSILLAAGVRPVVPADATPESKEPGKKVKSAAN